MNVAEESKSDPGVVSFILVQSHTFMDIDQNNEIILRAFSSLLPIQEGLRLSKFYLLISPARHMVTGNQNGFSNS